MYRRKYLQPNLIDPRITEKITATLNPPQPDYWAPTKNVCKNFFYTYVVPNRWFFIFFAIVIVYLVYRFIETKRSREHSGVDPVLLHERFHDVGNDLNRNYPYYLYEKQKDTSREPIHNARSRKKKRSKSSDYDDTTTMTTSNYMNKNPLAYPLYPDMGGSLEPSARRG